MMASEQPSSSPSPEEIPPPETSIPVPRPTHGTLEASPFLNGFDLVLGIGVIIVGFAIASFAVKNTDIWLHLGTGRLIAQGEYEFGKAPFTYSGGDRYWVNHSWLYDWITFKLYAMGDNGRAVVIFKALLIALTTAFMLFIKTPGASLWYGAVTVGLALIACAPRLLMQPTILSCLFLAITLYLLFRAQEGLGSWHLPAALGITFAIWANCDQWFFLGPSVVGLFLGGELLQSRRSSAVNRKGPSLKALALGLVVGIVACMANPHHVRIWELPVELAHRELAKTFENDPNLGGLFRGSFDKSVLDFSGGGSTSPANSLAFIALLLLNVAGVAANFRRLSWGLLFINIGALALTAILYRAIPFYAIVAAPVTTLNLGTVALSFRGTSLRVGVLQLVYFSRAGARLFVLLVGVAALVACWPGWLQPYSQARRLAFEVEPLNGIDKTARLLQQYRDEGKIPPEAHGLILDIDLANACAWFAPQEKIYFDLRLGYHWPEADTFVKVRRQLQAQPGEPVVEFNGPEFFEKENISYIVASSYGRPDVHVLFPLRMAQSRSPWELWDLSDRFGIFGWKRQKAMPSKQFNALRFNPALIAFGPDVQTIPDPEIVVPPTKRDLDEKFLTAPPTASGEAEESASLALYGEYLERTSEIQFQRDLIDYNARLLAIGPLSLAKLEIPQRQLDVDPLLVRKRHSAALLAIRAARRAILQSPDHPDGYLRLGLAYADPRALEGVSAESRSFLVTAMLERYFARATSEQLRSDPQASLRAAEILINNHYPPFLRNFTWQQLQEMKLLTTNQRSQATLRAQASLKSSLRINDEQLRQLIVELMQTGQLNSEIRSELCLASVERLYMLLMNSPQPQQPQQQKALHDQQEAVKKFIERLRTEINTQKDVWLNETVTLPPWEQADAARRLSLPLVALDVLKKVDLKDERMRWEHRFQVAAMLAQLYLFSGQAELAEQTMGLAEEILEQVPAETRRDDAVRFQRMMRMRTAMVLGRFSQAIELKNMELHEAQAAVKQARERALPIAAAISVSRSAFPAPLSFFPLWTFTNLQFVPNMMQGLGFRGNDPIQFPFYSDYYMNIIFNMQLLQREEAIHLDLAMIYMEQGDNEKALHNFQQAARPMRQLIRNQEGINIRLAAGKYLQLMMSARR